MKSRSVEAHFPIELGVAKTGFFAEQSSYKERSSAAELCILETCDLTEYGVVEYRFLEKPRRENCFLTELGSSERHRVELSFEKVR
jgi:hypothetical protein